jgi:hypothetical protein
MQRANAAQINNLVNDVRSDAPIVEIQHYALAGSGLARVIAKVVHTAASRANPKLVYDAIRAKFDNRMMAVAGSMHVEDKGPVSETISAVLATVRESFAVNEGQQLNGFKAIASNMFLDDEDKMWTLNKTESGSLMVRSTGIDDDQSLLGMLHAVASSAASSSESKRLAAVASSLRNSLEGGQYVSFVNNNNQMQRGFIVATAMDDDNAVVVLPFGETEAQQISKSAITDIHNTDQVQFPEIPEDEKIQVAVAASSGRLDIETIIDYYRRVYGHNEEYFAKLEALLREAADRAGL